MRKFIIETDLGHDPDDLLCLCHLAEIGCEIKAISLVPGSPEQLALAYGLRNFLGLAYEVGVSKLLAKSEHLGIHNQLINRHGWNAEKAEDGVKVFRRVLNKTPDVDVLVIGPASCLGHVSHMCTGDITFQGGFLPYKLYSPSVRLSKFNGHDSVPTFNFNGSPYAVKNILNSPFKSRRFCGKNVCHTISLTKDKLKDIHNSGSKAYEIYYEAMKLYFAKHDEKHLHDPTALVCHLHPEIATWFKGTPIRNKNGWSTLPNENGDSILADVDRESLWEHLLNRS